MTPLRDVRVARSDYYIAVHKEGYAPVERIASSAFLRSERGIPGRNVEMRLTIPRADSTPDDMVAVPGGEYKSVNVQHQLRAVHQTPQLVVNGRHDEEHPWATRGLPLWNLLREPKELLLIDGVGHHPPAEQRVPPIDAFLDRPLGPVVTGERALGAERK